MVYSGVDGAAHAGATLAPQALQLTLARQTGRVRPCERCKLHQSSLMETALQIHLDSAPRMLPFVSTHRNKGKGASLYTRYRLSSSAQRPSSCRYPNMSSTSSIGTASSLPLSCARSAAGERVWRGTPRLVHAVRRCCTAQVWVTSLGSSTGARALFWEPYHVV